MEFSRIRGFILTSSYSLHRKSSSTENCLKRFLSVFQFLLFVQYHRICIVIIIMRKICCENTVLYGMIPEGLFKEGLRVLPLFSYPWFFWKWTIKPQNRRGLEGRHDGRRSRIIWLVLIITKMHFALPGFRLNRLVSNYFQFQPSYCIREGPNLSGFPLSNAFRTQT